MTGALCGWPSLLTPTSQEHLFRQKNFYVCEPSKTSLPVNKVEIHKTSPFHKRSRIKKTKGARGGMICDRKVWTLFGPSTTDSCQKTTRRYGVCVVVINNDPTVYCNIDWFHLVCSFYASIFYPFCEQHGLETTLFPEKIEGWS